MDINYPLPEFVFLDGNSHDGNTLAKRTVIQHVRTYTIVEALALDEILESNFSTTKTHEFEFVNVAGIIEKHMLALHFTLADESELPDIFQKITDWYWDYLTWEDDQIINDEIR